MPVAAPRFRLPPETRIGTVALAIADLDRSLDYYRTVLGFRLLDRAGSTARLGAAGSDRALVALHAEPGLVPVPRRGRLGIYHFAVLLPDRGALGTFLRHASTLDARIGSAEHLVSEALYLIDPDGITIEVYRDRPREEWPIRQGQIVASIDPLDTEGVLAAGAGRAWEGLPAGTTIGHVHFFVDDLAEAEGFYHAALGFDKTFWGLPGMLFVAAGGYHHHVGLNTWAAGAPVATERDARMLYWELLVPDRATADTAADSLRRSGRTVAQVDGALSARDAWGITVRILESTS
ncbi:MAG: VOC family protein [Gemmatimonadales bacterium]